VKSFEVSKDEYVLIEQGEIDKIAPKSVKVEITKLYTLLREAM